MATGPIIFFPQHHYSGSANMTWVEAAYLLLVTAYLFRGAMLQMDGEFDDDCSMGICVGWAKSLRYGSRTATMLINATAWSWLPLFAAYRWLVETVQQDFTPKQ